MAWYNVLLGNLAALGFFEFVLPFLLAFAVIYGILLKTNILGQQKGVIGLVSLIVAFFFANYIPFSTGAVLTNLFGGATMIITGILVALLFIGFVGVNLEKLWEASKYAKWVVVVGLALVAYFLYLGVGGVTVGATLSSEAMAAIFMVIVMIIAVVFIAQGK